MEVYLGIDVCRCDRYCIHKSLSAPTAAPMQPLPQVMKTFDPHEYIDHEITYLNLGLNGSYPKVPTFAQLIYILSLSEPDAQDHIISQLSSATVSGCLKYIEMYPESHKFYSSIISALIR